MGSEKWTRTPSHVQKAPEGKTTLPFVPPNPPCWKIVQIFSNKNTGYEYATQKRLYSVLILCSIGSYVFLHGGVEFFTRDMFGYLASWNTWLNDPSKRLGSRHLFVDFPNEDVQLDARGPGEMVMPQFRPPKESIQPILFGCEPPPPEVVHLLVVKRFGLNGPYRHPNTTSWGSVCKKTALDV